MAGLGGGSTCICAWCWRVVWSGCERVLRATVLSTRSGHQSKLNCKPGAHYQFLHTNFTFLGKPLWYKIYSLLCYAFYFSHCASFDYIFSSYHNFVLLNCSNASFLSFQVSNRVFLNPSSLDPPPLPSHSVGM